MNGSAVTQNLVIGDCLSSTFSIFLPLRSGWQTSAEVWTRLWNVFRVLVKPGGWNNASDTFSADLSHILPEQRHDSWGSLLEFIWETVLCSCSDHTFWKDSRFYQTSLSLSSSSSLTCFSSLLLNRSRTAISAGRHLTLVWFKVVQHSNFARWCHWWKQNYFTFYWTKIKWKSA